MGAIKLTFKILTLVSLMGSQLAWGQTLEEKRLKSQSKFNLLNDVSASTNPQKSGPDQQIGLVYTAALKYKLSKKESLWVFGRLSKDFAGEERFDLLDTIVRYERSLGALAGFTNRLRLSAILPTNEDVHERTSFLGGASAQIRSGKSLGAKFYLNWSNTLRWNFHEFRISEVAGANTQATLSSSASLSYAVLPRLQLSGSMGWSWAKTYKEIYKSNYSWGVSASYSFTDKLSAYAGWTTGGSPLKADGRSTNFALFDERGTNYYLGLTHFY